MKNSLVILFFFTIGTSRFLYGADLNCISTQTNLPSTVTETCQQHSEGEVGKMCVILQGHKVCCGDKVSVNVGSVNPDYEIHRVETIVINEYKSYIFFLDNGNWYSDFRIRPIVCP